MKWYEDPVYIKQCEKAFPDEQPEGALMALGTPNLYVDGLGHFWYQARIDAITSRMTKPVPIKTQDQLQEMVGKPINELWKGIVEFAGYETDEYESLAPEYEKFSFTRLWLAFVMYEKYSKVWDSAKEDWVKTRPSSQYAAWPFLRSVYRPY